MAASHEQPLRRLRYTPNSGGPREAMTALKLRLLRYVGDYGIVSLPQLARLACPSPKSARRHMRELFDAGLVRVIAVPRAALAGQEALNDVSLMFGTAPNIYTLTRTGQKYLMELGFTESIRSIPEYGPRNSLFLAHELMIRDVRIWIELSAEEHDDGEVIRWCDGTDSEIALKANYGSKVLRPDAWFTCRLGAKILVGFVEADRGTERGCKRWSEKIKGYQLLFASGGVHATTGFVNARILVLVPNERRKDVLAGFLAREAPAELRSRFWLADRSILEDPRLDQLVWRQPGRTELQPIVPAEFLANPPAETLAK
jgi:hypothetical protein